MRNGELSAFAQRLKSLRQRRGLTRHALAKRCGLTYGTIANYEQDRVGASVYCLIALADYFNVSTDYLLGRDGMR